MDIKVSCGTTTDRKSIIIDNSKTPKDAMEQAAIQFGTQQLHLDGVPLTVEQVNMSFADQGITSDCMLIAVVSTKNA